MRVSPPAARPHDRRTTLSYTDDILADVQGQIAADDDVLAEARNRTNLVLDIALVFPGARRTFRSGSLAVHTFNDPVTDGDGGVVLDRRYYPSLGPDGGGEIPTGRSEEQPSELQSPCNLVCRLLL